MKKTVILLLALAVLLLAAGCSAEMNDETRIPDFSVEAIATIGDEGTSAADLLGTIMTAQEIEYTIEDGVFNKIDGYKNNDVTGWIFYIDGAPAESTPAQTAVVSGIKYELIWGDLIANNNNMGNNALTDVEENDAHDPAAVEETVGEPVNEGENVTPDDPEAAKRAEKDAAAEPDQDKAALN